MEFGKVKSLEGLNLDLPPDPPFNAALTTSQEESEPLHLYLGATGWVMREWVGRVYPPGTRSQDFLLQYGRLFNTIELNSTHYAIPKPETIHRWVEQTPSDFRFCPKVLQRLSHRSDLGCSSPQREAFLEALALFGDRLGCCFLQLPERFGPGRLPVLRRFLERWPEAFPLAVEFRHPGWFTAPHFETLAQTLHQARVGWVITDVAGRRDVCHMGLSAPFSLVRFVGNGLHPTDFQRADQWVERIRHWQSLGLKSLYFFAHQPDNLHAPQMIEYLGHALSGTPNLHFRAPTLPPEQSRQLELF
ncbi:MAG: DUF72 domain-containing protein [Bacteroidetes bacterium]|nr:MAG: DUF72 domain-containing protein [Bacteroidota bacterium]